MADPTSTVLRTLAGGAALHALRAGAGVLQEAIVRNGGTPSESDCDWVAAILRAMASAWEDELGRPGPQPSAATVGDGGQE
jgi:hypothetical protein